MSTDRELLELAAKAAGYASLLPVPISRNECTYLVEETDGGPLKPFNPLTDDGDALRLAVSLRMSVDFDRQHCEALVFGQARSEEAIGLDALASTRRAIVTCAAEIGRAMP